MTTGAARRNGRVYELPLGLIFMSGWQLADGLSAMHPESKILFVSGYAEQVVSSRGSIQTRDGFLQKPFTLRALALKVREVLESQKTSATAGA